MIPEGPEFHKPKSFIAAKNLVYASLFIGVLGVIVRDLRMGIPANGGAWAIFLAAAAYLFIIFLVKQLGFCNKWARTALLIVFILAVAAYAAAFATGLRMSIPEAALLVLQCILQIAALVFFFREECTEWLRSKKSVQD